MVHRSQHMTSKRLPTSSSRPLTPLVAAFFASSDAVGWRVWVGRACHASVNCTPLNKSTKCDPPGSGTVRYVIFSNETWATFNGPPKKGMLSLDSCVARYNTPLLTPSLSLDMKRIPNYPLWHPGRLTWNLQITHLERNMIFQTSMIMFHVSLQGCSVRVFLAVFLPAVLRLKQSWRSSMNSHDLIHTPGPNGREQFPDLTFDSSNEPIWVFPKIGGAPNHPF